MTDARTILLIGKTGNGKSALANILTGTSKFTENSLNDSKDIQIEEFFLNLAKSDGKSVERIKYQVIEAVSISNPHSSNQQTLYKLAELINSVKCGINQIFFVNNGRLTEKEIDVYKLLENVLFNKNKINLAISRQLPS